MANDIASCRAAPAASHSNVGSCKYLTRGARRGTGGEGYERNNAHKRDSENGQKQWGLSLSGDMRSAILDPGGRWEIAIFFGVWQNATRAEKDLGALDKHADLSLGLNAKRFELWEYGPRVKRTVLNEPGRRVFGTAAVTQKRCRGLFIFGASLGSLIYIYMQLSLSRLLIYN